MTTSYIASPPIVGVYRAETGEPLQGVELAIGGDSVCATPSLRATTDSDGVFSFPLKKGYEPVVILAPMDRWVGYTLCARVAGTMRFAFEATSKVNQDFGTTPVSLTCIEARTPNKAPVVCTREG